MKKAIIVHCWDGFPGYCWYPYVKRELEKKDFLVEVPAFPETEKPILDNWLPVLKEKVGKPDENTYLIGHSVGCITILRYLESLDNELLGGVILVAGFTDDLGFKELENFFTKEINFEKIRKHAKKFTAIHSDNDPFVPMRHGDFLKEKLGAELIVKDNYKHFSGHVDKEESCVELPDVVENILKISS